MKDLNIRCKILLIKCKFQYSSTNNIDKTLLLTHKIYLHPHFELIILSHLQGIYMTLTEKKAPKT